MTRPTAGEVKLERVLGALWDDANPLGVRGILAADEARRPWAVGHEAIDAWGMGAECVPATLGGRWRDSYELVRRARPVFRRDVSAGLARLMSSLRPAWGVWTAGTLPQQQRMGSLLLGGGRCAAVDHELHGRDGPGVRAKAVDRGFRLWGEGIVMADVDGTSALVLPAGPAGEPGSALFVADGAGLNAGRLQRVKRMNTSSCRGMDLSVFDLTGLPVSADGLIGEDGDGVEIVDRAFWTSGALIAGSSVGAVDTAVRTVLRFAVSRRLYGTTVARLPHARGLLTGAFVDLLIADGLSRLAARSLHLAPRWAGLHCAVASYLIPRLLGDAMLDLSAVLGARFYLREGSEAIFGKHLRDLAMVRLLCGREPAVATKISAEIVARGMNPACRDVPDRMFDLDSDVPVLDFSAIDSCTPGAGDLTGIVTVADDWPEAGELRQSGTWRMVAGLADERRLLIDRISLASRRRPDAASGDGGPPAWRLAERYSWLLASVACLGLWRSAHCAGEPFLGDVIWLRAALSRLRSCDHERRQPLTEEVSEALMPEMMSRLDGQVAFDATGTEVQV